MTLTDFDRYLFGEGTHREAYRKLGAHPARRGGVNGVRFAVWAPNAERVSVIGDFNDWQPEATPLSSTGVSGVWQGFVPNLGAGDLYKYAILPRNRHEWVEKADPYAFAAELRPATASVVTNLPGYRWHDRSWLADRAKREWITSAISVYELHLGSWRRDPSQPDRFLSYRELAETLPQYVTEMGYTHVELLPVAEFPLDRSWGYQVTGYFAPSARFGSPHDFMYLVDRLHRAGIGVIIDWVPAHFPRDASGLARFDGTSLYEHADPRRGEQPDWGTLIFNYGRHEVRSFLISNAVFWMDCYHIDGLRVDAVASMLYLDYSRKEGEWIPNPRGGRENLVAIDFLRELNMVVHERFPGTLMIAEESTAWPMVTGPVNDGGLGFDLKWNMGWMHDTLAYMSRDPIHRKYHQNELTFSLVYAFSERFVLPLSHDEVVHGKGSLLGKMPGDTWQKFANLRLLYAYMWGHPGKKLLYMGCDFGQWAEWDFARSLDWHLLDLAGQEGDLHRGLQALVRDLNKLYRDFPALHALDFKDTGFDWIDFEDAMSSVIVFQRRDSNDDHLVIVCNFTPIARSGYRVGLPSGSRYAPILNTDATTYGGSGIEVSAEVTPEAVPYHGLTQSAEFDLPPLGVLILAPE